MRPLMRIAGRRPPARSATRGKEGVHTHRDGMMKLMAGPRWAGLAAGRYKRVTLRASRWWGGVVMAGPGDELAAAGGLGRGEFRAAHSAAWRGDGGGDRVLRERMGVDVPPAVAAEFRREPPRAILVL